MAEPDRFYRTRDDRPRVHIWPTITGTARWSRGAVGPRSHLFPTVSAAVGGALGSVDARAGAVIIVEPVE